MRWMVLRLLSNGLEHGLCIREFLEDSPVIVREWRSEGCTSILKDFFGVHYLVAKGLSAWWSCARRLLNLSAEYLPQWRENQKPTLWEKSFCLEVTLQLDSIKLYDGQSFGQPRDGPIGVSQDLQFPFAEGFSRKQRAKDSLLRTLYGTRRERRGFSQGKSVSGLSHESDAP